MAASTGFPSTDMMTTTPIMNFSTDWSSSTPETSEADRGWGVGGIQNSMAVRIIYGLIAVSGITGNFLVCFAMLRIPSLRTRTSQFIIHLAVADLLTSCWVIPFNLFPEPPSLANTTGGEVLCRLYASKFPLWWTIFASVYSLVTVTLERYFAVVHPVKYKVMFSTGMSVAMMAATWIVGALSNCYFFVVYAVVDGRCDFVGYANVASRVVVGLYTFIVVYFIPITTTLYCHRKMIVALKQQLESLRREKRQIRAAGQKTKKGQKAWQLKATQEIQKTLFIVVITYMICWAPNQFIFLAYNLGAPVDFTQPYYHISVVFALCNSCVNPFIYVFKNKYFRQGLLEAVGCSEAVQLFINRIGPASTQDGDTAEGATDDTANHDGHMTMTNSGMTTATNSTNLA